jgi:hypothetical protein
LMSRIDPDLIQRLLEANKSNWLPVQLK